MKISIFGLGYVGTISAGCLAKGGHKVIGIDPYQPKVDLINEGKSPIIEKDISDIISDSVKQGRLRASIDPAETVRWSEISMICVGTPAQSNGKLNLQYVQRVCKDIGAELQQKPEFHVVVVRSTMLPGSMRNVVLPTLEEYSKKKAGVDFGTCINPEFLREGSAVHDYYTPPRILIGEMDARSGDMVASLYQDIDAPMIRTDIETAEMVKYTDNAWHALKVVFANEIGSICKALGVDGHKVMDIFCQDTKLNMSPCYLKPGFAFGGSCLPKDLRALNYMGRNLDLDLPVLNAVLPSNQRQIERALQMIMAKGNKKVGILGFSFKAGTDDLRESPMVEVIERLLGKGFDIRLYDRNVNLASLVGANRDYILNYIPHISSLMVEDLNSVLAHADTLVIGNSDPEFHNIPTRLLKKQVLIDLVRVVDKYSQDSNCDGICW